jgi:Tfp pilus assembly protein PilO
MSSKRRHSWLITLCVALAAAGFLWFAFIPTAKAIRETRNQIREKEDFIAQADAMLGSIKQSERNLTDVRQFTTKCRQQMPTPGHLADLFGKIVDFVNESGAIDTHFDPQPEVALEIVRRIPVHMQLTGSYQQIGRLIALLEGLPQIVWVEELKIEKQKEDGKDVQCDLKLEVFAGDSKESG